MTVNVTWCGTLRKVLYTITSLFKLNKDLQTLLQMTQVISPHLKGYVSFSHTKFHVIYIFCFREKNMVTNITPSNSSTTLLLDGIEYCRLNSKQNSSNLISLEFTIMVFSKTSIEISKNNEFFCLRDSLCHTEIYRDSLLKFIGIASVILKWVS